MGILSSIFVVLVCKQEGLVRHNIVHNGINIQQRVAL